MSEISDRKLACELCALLKIDSVGIGFPDPNPDNEICLEVPTDRRHVIPAYFHGYKVIFVNDFKPLNTWKFNGKP